MFTGRKNGRRDSCIHKTGGNGLRLSEGLGEEEQLYKGLGGAGGGLGRAGEAVS